MIAFLGVSDRVGSKGLVCDFLPNSIELYNNDDCCACLWSTLSMETGVHRTEKAVRLMVINHSSSTTFYCVRLSILISKGHVDLIVDLTWLRRHENKTCKDKWQAKAKTSKAPVALTTGRGWYAEPNITIGYWRFLAWRKHKCKNIFN